MPSLMGQMALRQQICRIKLVAALWGPLRMLWVHFGLVEKSEGFRRNINVISTFLLKND